MGVSLVLFTGKISDFFEIVQLFLIASYLMDLSIFPEPAPTLQKSEAFSLRVSKGEIFIRVSQLSAIFFMQLGGQENAGVYTGSETASEEEGQE